MCIGDSIRAVLKHLLGFAKNDFIHDDPPIGFRSNTQIEKTTFNFYHDFKQIWHELGYNVRIIPIPDHPSRILYHVKLN